MGISVANGFDVITKGRASRSRWPSSWTRRTRAKRGIDGGRRGAGEIRHCFGFQRDLRSPARSGHLQSKRRWRILSTEGQPRPREPRLTEARKG